MKFTPPVAVMFAALALLSGCGSGGDATTSAAPQADLPPATTRVFTIGSAVPQNSRSAIAYVASAQGKGNLGEPIGVPDKSLIGSALVAAIDSSGRVRLLADAAQQELSAHTSAMALARLLLGWKPLGQNTESIERSVAASSAYRPLVAAIETALANGDSLDESATVASALGRLIEEIAGRAPTALSTQNGRAYRAAVATPSLTHSGFTIVESSLGPARMSISASNGPQSRSLSLGNTTPLFWAAETQDQTGARLVSIAGTSTFDDGRTIVQPAKFSTSVLSALPVVEWFFNVPTTELTQLPTQGFNLLVSQTNASRKLNWEKLTYEILRLLLSTAAPVDLDEIDTCILALAKQANDTLFSTLSSEPVNSENLANRVKQIARAGILSSVMCNQTLSAKYKGSKAQLSTFIETVFPRLVGFLAIYERTTQATDAIAAFAMMRAMARYHTETVPAFGVCQTATGLGTAVISECTDRLTVDPFVDPWTGQPNPSPTLLKGSVVEYRARYFNISGAPVAMPASTTIDAGAGPIIAALTSNGARVTAEANGSFAFDLADVATGKRWPVSGAITSTPQLTPSRQVLAIGETTRLRLVDGFGLTVVADFAPLSWISSAPETVAITTLSGQTTPTIRAIRASTSPVQISASLDGVVIASSEITVRESVRLFYQPAGELFARQNTNFYFSGVLPDDNCNLQIISPTGIVGTLDSRPCDIVDNWGHWLPTGNQTARVTVTRPSTGTTIGESSVPIEVFAGPGPSPEHVTLTCITGGFEGTVKGGGRAGQIVQVVPENELVTVQVLSCGSWSRGSAQNQCQRAQGQPPETTVVFKGTYGRFGLEVGFGGTNYFSDYRFLLNRCQ